MYLETITSPADIKHYTAAQRSALAQEMRDALIRRTSIAGGHIGPNLGIVEATIALHTVFDSPRDKIVFDVSHQCYPHKMLTGRAAAYIDEAQYGAVSGFTNTDESPHDIFNIGHTSTSISLATGLAKARDLAGGTENVIALNGDGVLRANYFNKGAFDMFGTYVVDHGIYKLTIQNIIKKDFIFNQGGTITFGGDAYNANLNLAAQYVVNGVSLSDLNIGRRFSSNNIRVNCLMNITGTPKAPKIDFALDLPTVNSDAKQMVYSLINSEEEMNQQVLYLLAVGRFYSQGNNNAPAEQEAVQQSQTSLAMQSLLSGTISQQLNNVLSTVVNNTNWNFGANISTGDEGWNNAEYEGILNGRLLNNRLLINGQFGYRDNANATTSFIGDFDIRYLLFPNGNLAVRVYNQTNDRYFTRNSLNTQGLGFIIKKDFSGIKDLFGFHSKKKLKTVKEEKKATDKP